MSNDVNQVLSHLNQVLCSDLPSCGCGWPGEANRLVHAVLCLMPTYGEEKKRELAALIGSEGSQQIVLCALEKAGLITHGVSVDSADLAPRGRWVLWAVERVGGIDAAVAGLEEVGYPHAFDEACTDVCWIVPDGWEPGPPEPPAPVPLVSVPCPGASCPQYLYGAVHMHTAERGEPLPAGDAGTGVDGLAGLVHKTLVAQARALDAAVWEALLYGRPAEPTFTGILGFLADEDGEQR